MQNNYKRRIKKKQRTLAKNERFYRSHSDDAARRPRPVTRTCFTRRTDRTPFQSRRGIVWFLFLFTTKRPCSTFEGRRGFFAFFSFLYTPSGEVCTRVGSDVSSRTVRFPTVRTPTPCKLTRVFIVFLFF